MDDVMLGWAEDMQTMMEILCQRPLDARAVSLNKLQAPDMSGYGYRCSITCSLMNAGPGAGSRIFSALGHDFADAFYRCIELIANDQAVLIAEREKGEQS